MKPLLRCIALILILTTGASSVIVGQGGTNPPVHSRKMPKDLEGKDPYSMVDVIVQYKDVPTDRHHRKVTDKGGRFNQDLSVVKAGAYSMSAEAVEALSLDSDVEYITPDRPVHGTLDYATVAVGANIALSYGWDGTGVGVAIIDSGINSVTDLNVGTSGAKSRIVYEQSFLVVKLTATDEFGHGTHVAGIVAGNGSYSTKSKDSTRSFRGIAPKSSVINLRVLDSNGAGTDSAVIAAIQRAIQLKGTYNIRVINLSLGRPVVESYMTDPLCQAVESAWKAGIVVVVAAGPAGRNNSSGRQGYGTISSPANDPYVITVGAMKTVNTPSKTNDQIASYSSKGPSLIDHVVKPDLVAPGNRIISIVASASTLKSQSSVNLIPYSSYDTGSNTGLSIDYYRLSGTSIAPPMVSRAAALLLQKDPTLTPNHVKSRLMKPASKSFPTVSPAVDPVSGVTYTSQYDIFTIGSGYLDIPNALANADLSTKPALSSKAAYAAATGNVYVVTDSAAVWGDSTRVESLTLTINGEN